MFTGIVEAVGMVVAAAERGEARDLTIRAPGLLDGLAIGASVAVDGACLTVVAHTDDGFRVEVIGTTLSRTVAGRYREGTPVNLERALRLGDRLDGHLVQGHVDGVGRVLSVAREGDWHLLDLQMPLHIGAQTILHGSIAVNGVSLTVNALPSGEHCQVALIPHTWAHTNLSALRAGDPVNLEGDLIGKYVGRMLAPWTAEPGQQRG